MVEMYKNRHFLGVSHQEKGSSFNGWLIIRAETYCYDFFHACVSDEYGLVLNFA